MRVRIHSWYYCTNFGFIPCGKKTVSKKEKK